MELNTYCFPFKSSHTRLALSQIGTARDRDSTQQESRRTEEVRIIV